MYIDSKVVHVGMDFYFKMNTENSGNDHVDEWYLDM